jgi:hypothetical protein
MKRQSSKRMYFLVALILGLASVMSLWASAKVGLLGATAARSPQVVQHEPPTPAPASITVETVRLTPTGFEPNELERSAGKFILGIDNRIRSEEFSFEVVQENGHKVRQLKLPKGEIRLRKMLNLPAGRYSLREVDHPEWSCSIVLTP